MLRWCRRGPEVDDPVGGGALWGLHGRVCTLGGASCAGGEALQNPPGALGADLAGAGRQTSLATRGTAPGAGRAAALLASPHRSTLPG
jgi:hypothetical protein